MSGDLDARVVLSAYALGGADLPQIEMLAGAGGWSGSLLWRVTAAGGRAFCLRRWPAEHPPAERLSFIHTVLGQVAARLPVVAAPIKTAHGETYIEHPGHLWELTAWMPGVADYHQRPNRRRLAAAMHVLAQFHRLAAELGVHHGVPPVWSERQRLRERLLRGGLKAIEQALRQELHRDIDPLAVRLLPAARRAIESPRLTLLEQQPDERDLQPAIRDIHHDHVLFTGDEVTGLIDFGAMRIDTPLADVARLVGSLAEDDQEARSAALAAYVELVPLTEDDRRLIDLLDESGVVLGALNWLTWLYVERRDMGPLTPIATRLNMLLKRLETRQTRGLVQDV
jgi:homoserine kinase type II